MTGNNENPKHVSLAELEELLNVEKVENYLAEHLQKAKDLFRDEIREYRKLRVGSEKTGASSEEMWRNDKSYFFEFNKVENSERMSKYEWKLAKFKLENNKNVVRMVFPDVFIGAIDEADVTGQKITTRRFKSPGTQRSFLVDFMKPKEDRVVGFVKELGDKIGQIQLKNKLDLRNMEDLDADLMTDKIHRLVEEMEEVRVDIFCYLIAKYKDEKKKV